MFILQRHFKKIPDYFTKLYCRKCIHLSREQLAKSSSSFMQMPKSCNVPTKLLKITLNNGIQIPALGLGTCGSLEQQAEEAVKYALRIGYRLIDCAHVYRNENFVGKAFKAILAEGQIKREDIFVTSKLWNTYHRPEIVESAIKMSLNDLQLDYLDLYLIHWPMGYFEGPDLFPKDACGHIKFSKTDYLDTWKAMETLIEKRLTKSIGVCNFNKTQIARLLKNSKIPPVCNQVECHPLLTQRKLMEFSNTNKIAVMAYSPLGSPNRPWAKKNEKQPMLLKEVRPEVFTYPAKKICSSAKWM